MDDKEDSHEDGGRPAPLKLSRLVSSLERSANQTRAFQKHAEAIDSSLGHADAFKKHIDAISKRSDGFRKMLDQVASRSTNLSRLKSQYLVPDFVSMNRQLDEQFAEQHQAAEEARQAQLATPELLGELISVIEANAERSEEQHAENLLKQEEIHQEMKKHSSRLTVTQIIVVSGFAIIGIIVSISLSLGS